MFGGSGRSFCAIIVKFIMPETGFFSLYESVLKDLLQRSGFDHVILSPETGGEQAMFFCHQKPKVNKHEEL